MNVKLRTVLLSSLAAIAALLLYVPAATACGGLFDEEDSPPNAPAFLQEAEGVVFVASSDGTVTALVHIAHTGGARGFAWLLPVPGTPDVGLSTRRTFDGLLDRTMPRFDVDRDECEIINGATGNNVSSANNTTGNNVSANNTNGPGGQVQVLDEGIVGPYVYDTITVVGGGDANGEVARTWLVDNGYAVNDSATALLGTYLDAGMNIIAFKLESGASSDDIRPVSLRMQADDIMLPLRLASVGAVQNTVLRVWILGPTRAVSTNVPDVELNECLFTWSRDVDNYDAVLSAAVDEAGGRAFVTEFAGPPNLGAVALSPELSQGWTVAQTLVDRELVNFVARQFAAEDGLRAALREVSVEVDFDCATDDMQLNNSTNGGGVPDCIVTFPADFVTQNMLDAIERLVVDPAVQTQALLDSQGTLTALHTRISPDEMDIDPMFAFNSDRSGVDGGWDSVRVARADEACGEDGPSGQWLWRTPGGCEVWAQGFSWPFGPSDMPAAARIVQYGPSGAPEVIDDNAEEIRSAVDAHNAAFDMVSTGGDGGTGGGPGSGPDAGTDPGSGADGGGCCRVMGGADPGVGLLLVALAALALATRRRRESP